MLVEVYMEEAKHVLANAIKAYADRHKMNQTDMSILLDTSQPRMSLLFNKKIDKFTVDQLMKWAYTLGININIQTN
ncbi:hypothetical protein uav_038 [Pseudomonas phage UAVern]|uniref:HigA2-like helix-turn-helix domain-containing protein n=1 Tax=Pseudomonas phage UAVern TaxID=2856997 RepID=A0A975YYI3_9CAUD|nr:hypothetical protein uav_038 [Pseudomonas phage UAVern]